MNMFIVIIGTLLMMMLFTACQGLATTGTNGGATITGQVQSVNGAAHSVTLNVNGQQVTVSGLTDQQIALLQSQQGKKFTIQGTQTGTNTYTISTNTQPQENDNATPEVTSNTPENTNNNDAVNEPGSINFIGTVQSTSSSSITVRMPDGQGLSMNIVNGQTDMQDLNGAQVSGGQRVKVTASANPDGSFTISKLAFPKSDETQDQNTVKYQGVTTSAVGADNILNFKVGNKSFSFPIATGADLKDFNFNAHAISSNLPIKAKVNFNGSTGTVQSVDNGNHS